MNYLDLVGTFCLALMSGLIGSFLTYYFTKKTEDYKFELLRKEQAVKIAELFALWMKIGDDELKAMSEEEKRNHCEKLNRLTWELAIWVSDEEIVKNIMEKFSHRSKTDIKEIILSIRQQIHRRNDKRLKWEDLVYFK